MNRLPPILIAALLGLAPPTAGAGAADEVRATDMAFAARAAEVGQHVAFAEYMADDGVLFRPGAVRGQEWLATHEPATGQLEWSPAAVGVACSGRLAISSGPWRYTNAAGGEAIAGHYLSVWRRDDGGLWRVVLDHGIDHAAASQPAEPLAAQFESWWAPRAPAQCRHRSEARDLTRAEDDLNARVAHLGATDAVRRVAAHGAIAFRDDAPPARLTAAWPPVDARFGSGTLARSVGIIFDPAADLAVTHGVLNSADGTSAALYIRVWSRERRRWQLAIDLQTPLPATERAVDRPAAD